MLFLQEANAKLKVSPPRASPPPLRKPSTVHLGVGVGSLVRGLGPDWAGEPWGPSRRWLGCRVVDGGSPRGRRAGVGSASPGAGTARSKGAARSALQSGRSSRIDAKNESALLM